MLGMGSQTARSMDSRGSRSRTGSSMDAILQGRRDRLSDRARARENAMLRRMLLDQQKADRARDSRDERQETQDRLVGHKDNRKVIDLLEEIAEKLDNLDRHNGGLGNLLAGGLLTKLMSKFGLGSKGLGGGKLIRDTSGRWRDAAGRYAKGPERNAFGRAVDNFRNTKVGRGLSNASKAVAESPVGKFVGRVAKPIGRVLGKAAASPAGRILGNAARLGGNVLGKVAMPLAIGMSMYNGVSGMKHADEILGRKTNLHEKAAVGAAEAVNSMLLGVPGWISKHVFGMSFSKLMVDGLSSIGQKVRDTVTGTIDNAKNLIGKTVGSIGAYFSSAFESVGNYVKEVQTVGGELINAVKSMDAMGAATALGKLGKLLFKGVMAVPTAIGQGVTNAAMAGGKAITNGAVTVGKAAGNVANGVGNFVSSVAHKGVGAISALFESRGGVGTVSSGKGDHGGASYGKYQFASKNGSVQKYLKNSKYGAEFAGLAPGSAAFNAKWKEIAARDPKGFEEDQHNYIKKTHYDPMAAKIAKTTGLDVSKRGRAVQEAVFSTSVQYGAGSSVVQKALAGKDPSKMSDAEIVAAIQDYKASKVDSTFKSSSAGVKESVAGRIQKEKAILLSMASNPATNKVDVKGSMAEASVTQQGSNPTAARASSSQKATATPSHPPLIEELPELKPQPTTPQAKPESVQANAPSSNAQQAQKPHTSGVSSGRGGLPSVNDVADRPRIDLQPLATTLNPR